MSKRNESYDAVVAAKFQDLAYAQNYLLNIVNEEGLTVEEALRETIEAMGVKEFAAKAGLTISTISDFIRGKRWSTETLNKHISTVFKLKIKISLEHPDSQDVA